MTVYELWVPGEPVAKQRPRFQSRRRGGTFTPEKTINYEAAVREAWLEYGYPRLDEPVRVSVELQRAGAWVWVEPSGNTRVVGLRGDLDNYVKSIFDGLQDRTVRKTGEVFPGGLKDDRHVVEMEAWFHAVS